MEVCSVAVFTLSGLRLVGGLFVGVFGWELFNVFGSLLCGLFRFELGLVGYDLGFSFYAADLMGVVGLLLGVGSELR